MENKKWTREEAEQNKNNLLNELNELPVSKENLDWVKKELDQLIDEEEVRQKIQSEMKSPLTGKEMKLMSEPSTLNYRGKQYNVNHHFYLCELSNEQFTTTELDEINLEDLFRQIQ